MKDHSKSNLISARGMITNYQGRLVPMEDDVQHATVFHIHDRGKMTEAATMEQAVETLASIIESDGTVENLRTEDDYKQVIRGRFDRSTGDEVVESTVALVISRNFAAKKAR